MKRPFFRTAMFWGLVVALGWPGALLAEAERSRYYAGGYFRIMARPGFQGGDGRLGYWNLYGRLLNEGPWAALEVGMDLLPERPGSLEPWTRVHGKIEGDSLAIGDIRKSSLSGLGISQLYVQAGNVLLDRVVWQLGTLDTWFGDLGLYDLRPAQLFFETLGLSGHYRGDKMEILLGVGDSGYFLKGLNQYNTVLTAGGLARVRLGGHLEIGFGGQYMYEPAVEGNRNAPHVTPGVSYEDYWRGEVLQRYLEENPGQQLLFPRPMPTSADSFKLIGYMGFGRLGPLRWNNMFANFMRRHPHTFYTETISGSSVDIYVKDLTDERYELNVGNEAYITLIPGWLEMIVGGLFGYHFDNDNQLAPNEQDRTFWSVVSRWQLYLTDTFHFLVESSYAHEHSHNGNLFRTHADSIFANTRGLPDTRGLEIGDTDLRRTWQGKAGFVINPLGMGIFSRPSIRILYGAQRSNQNNAFGHSFVETVHQYNTFGNQQQHWHHVVSLEAEAWF